jgi:hypothetical protein
VHRIDGAPGGISDVIRLETSGESNKTALQGRVDSKLVLDVIPQPAGQSELASDSTAKTRSE